MVLAMTLIAVTTLVTNPNYQYNYTLHATRLHQDLLEDYNKAAPPMSTRLVNYSSAGTDVLINMRFYKIDTVNVADGSLRVKVWWRSRWQDDRLAWDPAAYGGITEVAFHAASFADVELSDIWLPDITIYNTAEGLLSALEPAMARVTSDGEVKWNRNGIVGIACRFSGLVMYPFDVLSCPIELGGWVTSGNIQGVIPDPVNGCLDESISEEVAMSSYTEYAIDRVTCKPVELEYASFPGEKWPMITFRLYLTRSTSFYVNSALIPSVLFALMSFGVFFMSFEVGERLGIGTTLVLTVEVSKATFMSLVPICGEMVHHPTLPAHPGHPNAHCPCAHSYIRVPFLADAQLWLELFFLVNSTFTAISLIESMVVLGLAYHNDERLLPASLDLAVLKELLPFSRTRIAGAAVIPSIPSVGSQSPRGMQVDASVVSTMYNTHAPSESAPGRPAEEVRVQQPATDLRARLIFFENLFLRLDVDGSNTISFDEMRRMFTFTSSNLNADEVDKALTEADSDYRDGSLNRLEFMDLCLRYLGEEPLDQLESAAINFAEFRLSRQRRINTKWRRVANKIDQYCRLWIPLLYVLTVVFVWKLDLVDVYEGRDDTGGFAPMRDGFDSMVYSQTGSMTAIMVVTIIGLLMLLYLKLVALPRAGRRIKLAELDKNHGSTSKTLNEFQKRNSKFNPPRSERPNAQPAP